MTEAGLAAIVLAAGKSTRMGCDKPLLPLGDRTVVERVVDLFQSSGITDVRVVVGHHAERLMPVVRIAGAEAVFNPRYAEGMFTSVAAGVRALDSRCPGFFILPVDVPLVRKHTIRRLADAWRTDRADGDPKTDAGRAVLHPTFMGRRGHPPLIGSGHIREILKWNGDGGLRAYLSEQGGCAREIPVADRFILTDMDTPEDYCHINSGFQGIDLPSSEECKALMVDILAVPPPVWHHCLAVADVAVILGQALNRALERGSKSNMLSLNLIRAAALVHDLARNKPDHARAGAAYLRGMGFPSVADIVAVHMALPPSPENRIEEAGIVFLADKLVAGNVRVTLEDRFDRQIARFGDDPDAAAAIARRLARARAVRDDVERRIGRTIASVLKEDHDDLPLSTRGD